MTDPKPPRRWPLAVQLTTVLVCILAVIAGIVWLDAQDVERQSLQRETTALKYRAAEAARRVEERVGRLRAYVEQVATNPSILASVETAPTGPDGNLAERAREWDAQHPEIHALLLSVREANPSFRNVYLLTEAGVCISSSERGKKPEMVGRIYDYRSYFRAPVDSAAPYVSDVLKNANSPGTGIFVSAPIIVERKVQAVVVLKVDSHALHEVVAELSRRSGRALLVDRFGVVVSDAADGEVQKVDKAASLQFRPLTDVARYLERFEETKRYGDPEGDNYLDRVAQPLDLGNLWSELRNKSSGAAEFQFPEGDTTVPMMLGFSPVWSSASEPYGYIVLAQSEESFREGLVELGRTVMLRFGIALVLILVISLWLIGRLTRRVQGLAKAAASPRLSDQPQRSIDEAGVQSPSAPVRRALVERLDARVRTPLLHVAEHLEVDDATDELATVIDELEAALLLAPGEPVVEARRTTVDLDTLLDDQVTRARGAAELHETKVTLDAADLGEIETDRRRLELLLSYVLGNACQFTRRGHVEVKAARQDDKVTITIRDNGIGMTRRQLEHLVDPFADEPADSPRLGIVIAIRTAELLDGTLAITSETGTGTTVKLTLPMRPRR